MEGILTVYPLFCQFGGNINLCHYYLLRIELGLEPLHLLYSIFKDPERVDSGNDRRD